MGGLKTVDFRGSESATPPTPLPARRPAHAARLMSGESEALEGRQRRTWKRQECGFPRRGPFSQNKHAAACYHRQSHRRPPAYPRTPPATVRTRPPRPEPASTIRTQISHQNLDLLSEPASTSKPTSTVRTHIYQQNPNLQAGPKSTIRTHTYHQNPQATAACFCLNSLVLFIIKTCSM